MTRAQRKEIEQEFYHYKQNRDKAASFVASRAYDNFGVDYSAPRVMSSPGNNVEKNVIRLIGEEDRAWRWCVVFQKTMEHFRWTQKDELMRRRYIEQEHYLATCEYLHISERGYYFWLDEIIDAAYMWAIELKIL